MKNKSYWYIPGHGYPSLLAIKVYRVEDSSAPGFWWMSEPIGHAVTEDELMTRTEAKKELRVRKEALKEKDVIKVGKQESTLHNWRIGQARFILSTYPKENRMTVVEFLKQFPPEEDTEWFS